MIHLHAIKQGWRQTGIYLLFSIIALLFVGAILLFISRAKQTVDSRSQQTTGAPASLAKIDLAIKSFVATQKRLPCPASSSDASGGEAPTGPVATCTSPNGVVPWGVLGLTSTDVLDPWGRKVSYRVYNGTTGFTQTDGLDASNCNTSSSLTSGVAISSTGACASYHESRYAEFLTGKGISVNDKGTLYSGVAYVLISHGATGNGSFGNDTTGTRSTLPNASSKEYPNTQVPVDNTYWIQNATALSVTPDDASHFDDVLYYKLASELLDDTKLSGRDWGTVTVDKAFSSSTVTTGGSVTLTITLSSTNASPTRLALPLVDTFPTNLLVDATPTASTTCASGTVTATAGGTSVSLSSGAIIPALGSCTVTVKVAPTQPVAAGAASINYSNTIAQYALEVTPNMAAATPPPTDAAAIRNMSASPTRVLTATPPPPIVTPSAGSNGSISPSTPQAVNLNSTAVFTLTPNSGYFSSSVGGTCGGTLSGNTYTTNPITTNCTVIASFATSSSPATFSNANVSAAVAAAGGTAVNRTTNLSSLVIGGVTLTASGSGGREISFGTGTSGQGIGVIAVNQTSSGAAITTSGAEAITLQFPTSAQKLGILLVDFGSTSGQTEQAQLVFKNGATPVVTATLKGCATGAVLASYTLDLGAIVGTGTTFDSVQVSALNRVGSSTSSSFLVGSVTQCASVASSCLAPTATGATACAYP